LNRARELQYRVYRVYTVESYSISLYCRELGPAGVAWEAACLRALQSLATCSDAAGRLFQSGSTCGALRFSVSC